MPLLMYVLREEHPHRPFEGRLGRVRPALHRAGMRLCAVPREAYVWIAGLLAMATMDPAAEHLISLCPLDALGLGFCPGCGLGHAIAHLARGEFVASFHAHPLGGPAVLVLLHRIVRLVHHP